MDAQRVREIIDSPEEIEVTYDGEPVWIDTVDFKTTMATVHMIWNPDEEIEVSVGDLEEHPQDEIDFLQKG